MIKLLENIISLVVFVCILISCSAIAGFMWLAFKFLDAFASFKGYK
jgi:hypothetical protein